ncbi:MAG: PhnD/SsuA/transferrin family substrate-binding protein [Cyanobacteria bacterium P01_E01_bin.42]
MKLKNLLVLSVLVLIACTPTERNSSGNSSGSSSLEPIASCPEELRFTVTDVEGEERLQAEFGSFQTALEDVLGVPVTLVPLDRSYVSAAPALMFDLVDLAFAGPSEYVLMNSKAKAIPLVGITRSEYHTVILANAESDIDSLDKLEGKTLGIRKAGSTASHLGALEMLAEAGLKPADHFKVEIVGSDRGLRDLKEGKLDAWAEGNPNYVRALEKYNLSESDFTLVRQGKPLPNDLLVANPILETECIEAMRSRIVENERNLMDAILAAPANKKFAESQIVPAKDEDYDMIREGYKAIGQEF